MRLTLTILFCLSAVVAAFPQVKIFPLSRPSNLKIQTHLSARTQDTVLTPLSLPFWDDFSHPPQVYFVDTTKWLYGRSVDVSNGFGLNPLSLGVATFNGLDSLDKAYDPSNNLAKGFADKLVSWAINLGSIPADQQDSVFLSFFYQSQGNGEAPDPEDHLLIEFKNDSGQWIARDTIDASDLVNGLPLKADTFYGNSIKVDNAFFHDQFQFRIRAFGRLSGPWDNWNIDYVFLNAHRSSKDFSTPDRTIYEPLSSLFGDYWAIPAPHFHADTTGVIMRPSFAITNVRQDQPPGGQPIQYSSGITINEWKEGAFLGTKTLPLDVQQFLIAIEPFERRIVPLHTLPAASDFTPDSDSISLSLNVHLETDDNSALPGTDYLPKYVPLDFRVNDYTSANQVMSSFYAYDDGTAEFGAGLNQAGTEMAYRFDMKTTEPDNILSVDFYFPNVGDQSNQTIRLLIRKDTSSHGILYSEIVTLQRGVQNNFWHHKLNVNTVRVKDTFFVGWEQRSTAVIAVGLDQSHDTSDKIYFNVNGYWEIGPDLKGSLMIRPHFGPGGVETGFEEEPSLDVFPNPSAGIFFLNGNVGSVEIFDFTGRRVEFAKEVLTDRLKIELQTAASGIYLIKALIDGKAVIRKIIVRR